MAYGYDNGTRSFQAKLNVSDKLTCSPVPCANSTIFKLAACNVTSVTISDKSCSAPFKRLTLYVPPGKYKLITTCTFTKTGCFHVWCRPRVAGTRHVREQGEGKEVSRMPVGDFCAQQNL